MIGSDLKQLIVLDEIRDKIEMLDSDIIPESVQHPIVSGIENVPTSISSINGTNFQSTFTTFPLSPLTGRVNHLRDNFLNFNIDINFGIYICENLAQDVYMYVGPRDTSSIFNQLTLLIDNNTIFNTTYQQVESAIAFASLPSNIVNHSNMYATVDKLLSGQDTPMKLIKIPANDYSAGQLITYNLHYQFTIDLNRLCVPLSNIDYISNNMGNLRLKVYLQNIMNSFYYFVVPSGLTMESTATGTQAGTVTFWKNSASLLTMNPIQWASGTLTPVGNIVTFPTPAIIPIHQQYTQTITAGAISHADPTTTTINNNFRYIPIQFVLNADSSVNTVAVQLAEICQTCFDIDDGSYAKLSEYFGSMTKVVLPIQQFTTSVFNNGTITPQQSGTTLPSTLLANVPANNISEIIVTQAVSNAQSCIINPYLSNVQCLLDGKTLNNVPYSKIDNRAITDFTMACVDTDSQEINDDYLYSLTFPKPIITGNSNTADLDDTHYFTSATMFNDYNELGYKIKNDFYVKNPNLYMYVFETQIPGAFHTGACVLENSNRQAILRLVSDGNSNNKTNMWANYPYKISNVTYNTNTNAYTNVDTWVNMPNTNNTGTTIYLTVLSDSCIVLDYQQQINTCTGGFISNAKPYINEA